MTIVAADIAFDATTFDATVGATVTITFDNRDEGIAHNLHVEGTSAGDAKTEIEERPITQTLDVAFDEAGEFAYFCDVHPQQMRGTVTVSHDRRSRLSLLQPLRRGDPQPSEPTGDATATSSPPCRPGVQWAVIAIIAVAVVAALTVLVGDGGGAPVRGVHGG